MIMKGVCKITYHYGHNMAMVPPLLFRSPRWGVIDSRAQAWKLEGLKRGIPMQAAFAGRFRDTENIKISAKKIQETFRKYLRNKI